MRDVNREAGIGPDAPGTAYDAAAGVQARRREFRLVGTGAGR
jgi:hypothetical protein